MLVVLAPVFHAYVFAPLAVSVVLLPLQIVVEVAVILAVGNGFTVTVVEDNVIHPFTSVTVQVYTVAPMGGVSVPPPVVAPVLHKKVYGAVPPVGRVEYAMF